MRTSVKTFVSCVVVLCVISSSLTATPYESPYGVGVIWSINAAGATGSDDNIDLDYGKCLSDSHSIEGFNNSSARSEYEACLTSGVLSAYSYAQGGPYQENPNERDIGAGASSSARFWDTLYFSRADGREVYGTLTIEGKLMYDLLVDTQCGNYGFVWARYRLELVSLNDHGEIETQWLEEILGDGDSDCNDFTLTVPIRGPGAQVKFKATLGYGYPVRAGVGDSYHCATHASSSVRIEWECVHVSSGISWETASGDYHRCWRRIWWPPQEFDPGWIDIDSGGIGGHGSWLYPLVDPAGHRMSDYCGGDWKNHGQFMSCVAHIAEEWLDLAFITEEEKDTIVSGAARSDVGKKDKLGKGGKKK